MSNDLSHSVGAQPHWFASAPTTQPDYVGVTEAPHASESEGDGETVPGQSGPKNEGESSTNNAASNGEEVNRITKLLTMTLAAHNTYSGLTAKIAYQEYIKESLA